jgi:iron(III) transport system substrate-binding protein
MKTALLRSAALAGLMMAGGASAHAESLTLYCSADEAWCQQIKTGFEEKTGITVDMTRKSSGEIYAQVKAEARIPRGDIWWGGTGDPHLQAAEEGLTRGIRIAGATKTCTTGRSRSGTPPRSVRSAFMPARSASATTHSRSRRRACLSRSAGPICSSPKLKDDVQVADPNSSGTAYTTARHDGAADGRGEGLRLPQGPAQERQPVHQVGLGAGQGGEPRRDRRRHRLHP